MGPLLLQLHAAFGLLIVISALGLMGQASFFAIAVVAYTAGLYLMARSSPA